MTWQSLLDQANCGISIVVIQCSLAAAQLRPNTICNRLLAIGARITHAYPNGFREASTRVPTTDLLEPPGPVAEAIVRNTIWNPNFRQFNLGFCYYNGQGVAQDHGEAKRLWQLAAKQGHADAKKQLAERF